MAQSDVNLLFSQAQQVTVSGPSTMTYDMAQGPVNSLSGTYQTNAAAGLPMTFGNAQFFGEDLGIGRLRLSLGCWVNVAYSGGTSLQISWQGAIDNGGGTIANAGTLSALNLDITSAVALALTPTAVKTTTSSAAANDLVVCDTTSGAFTVTLPMGSWR